jgi:2-deoxy-D-gluconate 3-dehydrogenase
MSETHDIKDWNLDVYSLKGKVAIVTGGNTGLGQSYCVAFAKAGAKVFVATEMFYDGDETPALLDATGAEYEMFKADLFNPEERASVIPACIQRFGTVDILVNNAGIMRAAPVLEYTDQDWRDIFTIHVDATFYLSREAAKVMVKKGGGKIINIVSLMAYRGDDISVGYTACKHAIAGITKSFANALGKENIQVNAIAPGWIKTAGNPPGMDVKAAGVPAGRLGVPYDLMGLAVYLASPASDYVSGVIIPADGAYLIAPL